MNKKDFLSKHFEKIIREYDVNKEITEKDYERISNLFSLIVQTSPKVRDTFFKEMKVVTTNIRLKHEKEKYEIINDEVLKEMLADEVKEKIYN